MANDRMEETTQVVDGEVIEKDIRTGAEGEAPERRIGSFVATGEGTPPQGQKISYGAGLIERLKPIYFGLKYNLYDTEEQEKMREYYNTIDDDLKSYLEPIMDQEFVIDLGNKEAENLNNRLDAEGLIRSGAVRAIKETDPNSPIPMYAALTDLDARMKGLRPERAEAPELEGYSMDPVRNQAIVGIASNILGTLGGLVTGKAAEGVAAGAAGAAAATSVAEQTAKTIQDRNQANNKMLVDFAQSQMESMNNFSEEYLKQVGQNQRKLLEESADAWWNARQTAISVAKTELEREKVQLSAAKEAGKINEAQYQRDLDMVNVRQKNIDIKNDMAKTKFKEQGASARVAMRANASIIKKNMDWLNKNSTAVARQLENISYLDPTIASFNNNFTTGVRQLGQPVLNAANSESAEMITQLLNTSGLVDKDFLYNQRDRIDVAKDSRNGFIKLANFIHTNAAQGRYFKIDNFGARNPSDMLELMANVERFSKEAGGKDIVTYLKNNGVTFSSTANPLTSYVNAMNLYSQADKTQIGLDFVTETDVKTDVKFQEGLQQAATRAFLGSEKFKEQIEEQF